MVAAWALSIFFCLIVYCKILHGNFFDRSVSLAVEICSNRENAMTDFPSSNGQDKKGHGGLPASELEEMQAAN
jgi:hypothetical protein